MGLCIAHLKGNNILTTTEGRIVYIDAVFSCQAGKKSALLIKSCDHNRHSHLAPEFCRDMQKPSHPKEDYYSLCYLFQNILELFKSGGKCTLKNPVLFLPEAIEELIALGMQPNPDNRPDNLLDRLIRLLGNYHSLACKLEELNLCTDNYIPLFSRQILLDAITILHNKKFAIDSTRSFHLRTSPTLCKAIVCINNFGQPLPEEWLAQLQVRHRLNQAIIILYKNAIVTSQRIQLLITNRKLCLAIAILDSKNPDLIEGILQSPNESLCDAIAVLDRNAHTISFNLFSALRDNQRLRETIMGFAAAYLTINRFKLQQLRHDPCYRLLTHILFNHFTTAHHRLKRQQVLTRAERLHAGEAENRQTRNMIKPLKRLLLITLKLERTRPDSAIIAFLKKLYFHSLLAIQSDFTPSLCRAVLNVRAEYQATIANQRTAHSFRIFGWHIEAGREPADKCAAAVEQCFAMALPNRR